ncbi:MAG TPA: hypothetical protein VFX35_07720 [Solirubrobacterales bacterium]|nr:hypothetical protein [Solirubrobacterales bacterium]
MSKKLIMSCMALVAFAAFVLPATASATNDPQLTETTFNAEGKDIGTHTVPPGAKVIGTNIGNADFMNTTGEGTPQVSCSSALLTGTVTKNEGGTVEGSISTADFSGTGPLSKHNPAKEYSECTASIGNAAITVSTPLVIKSDPTMATDEFRVSGTGAGGTVTFNIVSTVAGQCKYLTTSTVKGDYTTAPATTKLVVRNTQAGSGAKLEEGGFLCPTSGQLRMTFFLETEDGTELSIS